MEVMAGLIVVNVFFSLLSIILQVLNIFWRDE